MILTALAILVLMAFIFGALLGYASLKFKVDVDPVVDQINELLPQTQCGQCGYPGCQPYAEAIAQGDEITKCVPGGTPTVKAISELLDRPIPQNSSLAAEVPEKMIAFIDEQNCIGCTKCIQACPVDAIVGSTKLMHTVIRDYCTGCELCVEPCPTDCIEMHSLNSPDFLLKKHLIIQSVDVTDLSNESDRGSVTS